jgi:hypothetical protein
MPARDRGPVASSVAPATSPEQDWRKILREAQLEYPALSKYQFDVITGKGPGYVEFYPPDEIMNPRPGRATIELREQSSTLQDRESQKNLIIGETLHHLGQADPEFKQLKKQFGSLLTPEQLAVDQRAYQQEQGIFGELGPFPDWMERSRVDAYIRGYLFPSAGDDWRTEAGYTPEQKQVLNRMLDYLKRGQ